MTIMIIIMMMIWTYETWFSSYKCRSGGPGPPPLILGEQLSIVANDDNHDDDNVYVFDAEGTWEHLDL